jgi:hypothetical protein
LPLSSGTSSLPEFLPSPWQLWVESQIVAVKLFHVEVTCIAFTCILLVKVHHQGKTRKGENKGKMNSLPSRGSVLVSFSLL